MAIPEEAQGAYELRLIFNIPTTETQEQWSSRMANIPHLLFADDADTYLPGTMMALLVAYRFNQRCDLGSTRVNESWDVSTALTELFGTIEGVILLGKWAERYRLLTESNNDKPHIQYLGITTLAGMTAAICVEKAMKTLIALDTVDHPTPKKHNLNELWSLIPPAPQTRLEAEMASLPVSWRSPHNHGEPNISTLLSTSKDAFVDMRYVPEMQPAQSRTITQPLAMAQIAATLFLVCIENYKPGTLKA